MSHEWNADTATYVLSHCKDKKQGFDNIKIKQSEWQCKWVSEREIGRERHNILTESDV